MSPENPQGLLPTVPLPKMCIKHLFWNCDHWHRRLLALAVARSTPQRCSWLTHYREMMKGQGMQTPYDEISSRLSHVMNLSLQPWTPGQVAGSVVCLYQKGLFKIATAGAYLQSVAIVPDHQFSDLPFLEFCWSFLSPCLVLPLAYLIIYPLLARYCHQITCYQRSLRPSFDTCL